MKLSTNSRDNAVLIIVAILLISFMLNVYQSIYVKKYKLEIDRTSCENIETIRYTNETILSILDKSISTKSLSNEDLLTLYKNYTQIANAEVELGEHYLKLRKSNSIFNRSAKAQQLEMTRTEILWKLEEYIYAYLLKEMAKGNEIIKIDDNDLSIFISLRNMSNDVNNYFIEFTEKHLNNLKGEERTQKIIKEQYWIDMLFGMIDVTSRYINYEFISKE